MKNLKIDAIKQTESPPKIIKNFIEPNKINDLQRLYEDLPLTVHNKKQNVKKKRWFSGYRKNLEEWYFKKLHELIGDFKMDNLLTEKKEEILGLFQESYSPIGLHVDAGFNPKNSIYKQTLIPLSPNGSTVIFKNKFYEGSTNFTLDEMELNKKEYKVLCEWSTNDFVLDIQNKMFDMWFRDNQDYFSKESFLNHVESNEWEFDENGNLF